MSTTTLFGLAVTLATLAIALYIFSMRCWRIGSVWDPMNLKSNETKKLAIGFVGSFLSIGLGFAALIALVIVVVRLV